jgi:hypothetical protein
MHEDLDGGYRITYTEFPDGHRDERWRWELRQDDVVIDWEYAATLPFAQHEARVYARMHAYLVAELAARGAA